MLVSALLVAFVVEKKTNHGQKYTFFRQSPLPIGKQIKNIKPVLYIEVINNFASSNCKDTKRTTGYSKAAAGRG